MYVSLYSYIPMYIYIFIYIYVYIYMYIYIHNTPVHTYLNDVMTCSGNNINILNINEIIWQ